MHFISAIALFVALPGLRAAPVPDFEATILAASDFLNFETFQSVSVAGVAADVTTYELIHFSDSFHSAGTATLIEGSGGYTLTFDNPGAIIDGTTEKVADECQFLGTTAASCVGFDFGLAKSTAIEPLVATFTVTASGDRPTVSASASPSVSASRIRSASAGASPSSTPAPTGISSGAPPEQSSNAGLEGYRIEVGTVIAGVVGCLWAAL
ncbi:hypothetical protein DFH06DRAFT_1314510 [Mycena polygramma]|nr:hypothetical protein DFH06DRAFT_1314510 [Mycena polygramma]